MATWGTASPDAIAFAQDVCVASTVAVLRPRYVKDKEYRKALNKQKASLLRAPAHLPSRLWSTGRDARLYRHDSSCRFCTSTRYIEYYVDKLLTHGGCKRATCDEQSGIRLGQNFAEPFSALLAQNSSSLGRNCHNVATSTISGQGQGGLVFDDPRHPERGRSMHAAS